MEIGGMDHSVGAVLARRRPRRAAAVLAGWALVAGGCTTFGEWVHNGFKVGPSYHAPPAAVATTWIDSVDRHIVSRRVEGGAWWAVFQDPVLDSLINTAHRQNLDLRTAATRVLQAQA